VALAVPDRGGGPGGAVRFTGAVDCSAVGDGLDEGLVQPDIDTDKQMMRTSEIEIAIAVFFFILVTSFDTVLLAILRAHFFSTLQLQDSVSYSHKMPARHPAIRLSKNFYVI
jgi:hypothetical protein